MAGVVAVGSVAFTLIKVVLHHLSPLSLAAGRVVFSAIAFTAVVTLQPKRRRPIERADRLRVLACGLGGSAGFHIVFSWGQSHVSVPVSAVVLGSMPAMVALGEVLFLHHRLTRVHMAGLLLSVLGVAVISSGSGGSGHSTPAGIVAVIAATMIWSAVTLVTRSLAGRYDPWWLNTPGTVLGAVIMLALSANRFGEFTRLPLLSWVWLIWLGAVGSAFIYAAVAGAMKALSATTAASLATLVTPAGIVVAWIAIGDRPGINAAIGSAAVIGGVTLVSRTTPSRVAQAPG